MSTPALSAEKLVVGYRFRRQKRPVLPALDLAVRGGEFVCLLGPNGAGKSTLLRTLATVQRPLAGTLRIGGADAKTLRQVDIGRSIGLVQTERLDVGALTAFAVVGLGRYPHVSWGGRLGEADHAAIWRALDAVGAYHLAERDIGELSDGERQRINIARALAQEPAILVLDEPTAFLDVGSRVELMGLLRRLARENGLAVVASTHDLDLALRSADTVWLTSLGRFEAGAPEDLVHSGEFEAAFGSERIAFRTDERTFRLRTGSGRPAIVRGDGLSAILAGAVLEREGWAMVAEPSAGTLVVTAGPANGEWRAELGGTVAHGSTYAELATLARDLPDHSSSNI
ncbi:MAG: ABC transporter ATP-binding protein [Bauldia sp.]|nr:ABC transporter ATP-binding protein [Bauldia sp.]